MRCDRESNFLAVAIINRFLNRKRELIEIIAFWEPTFSRPANVRSLSAGTLGTGITRTRSHSGSKTSSRESISDGTYSDPEETVEMKANQFRDKLHLQWKSSTWMWQTHQLENLLTRSPLCPLPSGQQSILKLKWEKKIYSGYWKYTGWILIQFQINVHKLYL